MEGDSMVAPTSRGSGPAGFPQQDAPLDAECALQYDLNIDDLFTRIIRLVTPIPRPPKALEDISSKQAKELERKETAERQRRAQLLKARLVLAKLFQDTEFATALAYYGVCKGKDDLTFLVNIMRISNRLWKELPEEQKAKVFQNNEALSLEHIKDIFKKKHTLDRDRDTFIEVLAQTLSADKNILRAQLSNKKPIPKVVHLNLSNKSLSHIPQEIELLRDLQSLNCAHNNLSGLPNEIGNLRKLVRLDCSHNQFSFFPNSIIHLDSLEDLECHHNRLSTLPDDIENLQKLIKLNCAHNCFFALSPTLKFPESLQEFNCSYNMLIILPNSFRNFRINYSGSPLHIQTNEQEAVTTDISPEEARRLKGEEQLRAVQLKAQEVLIELFQDKEFCSALTFYGIPQEITLTAPDILKNIMFFGQKFWEALPEEKRKEIFQGEGPFSLEHLKTLFKEQYEQDRNLDIFAEAVAHKLFANRSTIREKLKRKEPILGIDHLDLFNKGLSHIPKEIKLLQDLQSFNCAYNNLSELPEEIGDLGQLTHLDCSHNQLSSLPDSVTYLSYLENLDCYCNRILKLPKGIGDLGSLISLNCCHNQISMLPNSLIYLTNLETLICSHNHLFWLPDDLGNIRRLKRINCSYNHLREVPKSIKNLMDLLVLDCSENLLTELFENIGDCENLKMLFCDNNWLPKLPENIGDCTSLTHFSCHANQLSELPESVAALGELEVFDCSNNNLSAFPADVQQLFSRLIEGNCSHNPLKSLPDGIESAIWRRPKPRCDSPPLTEWQRKIRQFFRN